MGVTCKRAALACMVGCLAAAGTWAGWVAHTSGVQVEPVAAAPECASVDCFYLWVQREPAQAASWLQVDIATVFSRAGR